MMFFERKEKWRKRYLVSIHRIVDDSRLRFLKRACENMSDLITTSIIIIIIIITPQACLLAIKKHELNSVIILVVGCGAPNAIFSFISVLR